MVELELVGLSEDGRRLVLVDAAGTEFAVPMDDRLRTAVRGDRAGTGQLENEMERAQTQAQSTLRPRDIQARIRSGEAPEAVAEVAQVPVDKIMGYAVPVMAERQHTAERAQRSAIRRKHVEGPGQLLGDAVAQQLRSVNVDPDTCVWDAWRREDGRWTVLARFRGEEGERTGRFLYDALSRYAVADDDDGRWLVGDRVPEPEPETPTAGHDQSTGARSARAGRRRRLSAVASEYDASLFDADEEPTADLTAVADVLRSDDAADAATARGDGDGDGDGAADAGDPGDTAHAPGTEAASRARVDEDGPETDESVEEPVAQAASGNGRARRTAEPRPEKRTRRGRGRASVPSWDEIMFGQRKE